MGRNVLEMMEDEEFEHPLAGSGLGAPEDELASMDDADPAISVDDTPAAPSWDALLEPAAAPMNVERQGRAPPPAPRRGRSLPRMDESALTTARAEDRQAQAKAKISSGLDTVAFRRPFETRDTGSKNVDALMKDFSLKRQGALDERQLDRDAAADELARAKLSQPKARSGSEAQDELMRLRADKLRFDLDKPDSTEADAEELAALREYAKPVLGDGAMKMGKAALLKLVPEKLAREAKAKAAAKTKAKATSETGVKEDAKFNEEVRKYSEAIPEGAAGFYEQARVVDGLLEKYRGGDLPGVGSFDSRKPSFLQSDDGIEMQKNVNQMMLAYQKLVTGAGGSAEELQKIREAGADLGNERTFERGFKSLQKNYDAFLRKIQGGYRPEVVKKFEERVPEMRVPQRAPMPSGELGARPKAPRRTDPATGETRVWNGSAWVKE